MERIGKQYINLNGRLVTGVIWSNDYNTGVAQYGKQGLAHVKFLENAPGVTFPLQQNENPSLKSIWTIQQGEV